MKQSWAIRPLGDIISFERGLTYAKGDEVEISSIGVLRSNNVDLTTQSLNLDEIKYIRDDFVVPEKKKVKKFSLLMCMSNGSKDHLGKVALIDQDLDFAFGGFMGLLTPNEAEVFPKYLYYALASKSFKDYIHSLADGANINNLKYRDLAAFQILVPSLPEQQRIVDILDQEFAKIDALKVNAEKSLQAAKDLFQATMKKELEPKEGWRIETFSSICRVINGRAYSKDEFFDTGKYPVLRVGNFFTNDKWYYSNLELDEDKYCDNGDLLYAWSASFGPRIWRGGKVIYHYHIWKLESTESAVSKEFLYYWLMCPYFLSQTMNDLHGTTMAHITKNIMEHTRISFPSLPIQDEIVQSIERASTLCKALQENCQKTLALCDDLKQSLLRKAFNGEL